MAYPQKQRQDETNTTFKFRKLQITGGGMKID